MDLNIVKIKGNLTRDPELKKTTKGKAVCELSIANNQRNKEVSYFDVEVWGAIAEDCSKNLKKGNGVIIDGRLKQDRWEKNGKPQSRIKITASNIEFLFNKSESTYNQVVGTKLLNDLVET